MEGCIKEVVSKVGVPKRLGFRPQDTWWWNEEVKKVIKVKREWYKRLLSASNKWAFKNIRDLRKR